MPKIPTRHLVKFTRSDRHGGYTDETPVEIPNGEKIANELIALINKNDVVTFKTELNKLYNYPRIAQEFSEGGDIQTDLLQSEYAIHPARPRVEALFFDHPAQLAKVVNALVNANNPELTAAFMASLQQTELTDDTLFVWDMQKYTATTAALNELNNHGEKLKQQGISKGKVILALHSELQKELAGFVSKQKPHLQNFADLHRETGENIDEQTALLRERLLPDVAIEKTGTSIDKASYQTDVKHSPALDTVNKLQVLQFKLNFTNKLHENDAALSVHRGWKRVLANFATIFTGFLAIATVVSKIITGHWLFADKTTSEEKIDKAQKALGFNKEMHFEVQPKQGLGK